MKIKGFALIAVVILITACPNPFLHDEGKAPNRPKGLTTTTTANATSSSITISWPAVKNATGYYIYRSTSLSGTYTKVGESKTTSYTDPNISAGTTYYYKVAAYNKTGTGSQSEAVSKVSAPAIPTGLIKTTATSTSITISWSSVSSATGYNIYRSNSSTGTFTQAGTSDTTSYTNTGLSPHTTYYYKVEAYNGGGKGSQSAYVQAATAPGIPTGLTKTAATSTSITISWSAVDGATGYNIYRSTTSTGFTQVGTSSTTSFESTGLLAGTTYYFTVAAYNSNGTGTQSASTFSVMTMLAIPTGLTTMPASTTTSITISWDSVTDATGYYVYRSTSSTGPFTQLTPGTSTTTSYTDTGITTNTTYYYKVAAYNSAGTGSQSDAVSQNNGSAPTAPTGLTKTAATSTSITISWSSVAGATGYRIFRSASSTGTFTQVGTTTSPTTSYTNDTGLTAGTTYYYKVAAYNSANGTGYQSAAFSVTTMGIPTGLVTTGSTHNSITISWNSVTDATGYYIYRSSSSTGTFTQVGNVTSPTTSYTNDTGLSTGTIYFYKVAAYNSFGTGSQSTAVSQQTQYSSSYTLSISGMPRVGQTLTVSTGGTGWTDSTISWCYASSAEGDLESDGRRHFYNLSNASSFTIPATHNGVSMVGKYIRAFRRHPSGSWEESGYPYYKTFPSNFLGPIQSNN